MLRDKTFYHGTIRKTIIMFGRMFSNIYIERKAGDSVDGTLTQTLKVPIAYAPKEKWLVRLEQDPNLEQHTYVSLPRMSFEINGYSYDASKKAAKMNKITCNSATGSKTVFSPSPWIINISLYILTKTQEDAMQIIEQILPTFAPQYTISIKPMSAIDDLVDDIPITLESVDVSDDYDGDFQTRRFVIHTLTFSLKVNLYGDVSTATPISDTTVNVSANADLTDPFATHDSVGDLDDYTITSSDWTYNF